MIIRGVITYGSHFWHCWAMLSRALSMGSAFAVAASLLSATAAHADVAYIDGNEGVGVHPRRHPEGAPVLGRERLA